MSFIFPSVTVSFVYHIYEINCTFDNYVVKNSNLGWPKYSDFKETKSATMNIFRFFFILFLNHL